MDVYPVTNKEYLKFVKENPKWKRSKVISLFADKTYLINWASDTILKKSIFKSANNKYLLVCCKCLLRMPRKTFTYN